jgi:hypothetical protein
MSEINRPQHFSKELIYSDYLEHPIWGFWDDDGDDVTFADDYDSFDAVGGEALWVRCEFILNDATRLPGVVGIRCTDWSIYLLKFVKSNGTLFVFPVNSMLEGKVTPSQLAKELNKSANDIFPIRYETVVELKDGKPFVGVYQWSESKILYAKISRKFREGLVRVSMAWKNDE